MWSEYDTCYYTFRRKVSDFNFMQTWNIFPNRTGMAIAVVDIPKSRLGKMYWCFLSPAAYKISTHQGTFNHFISKINIQTWPNIGSICEQLKPPVFWFCYAIRGWNIYKSKVSHLLLAKKGISWTLQVFAVNCLLHTTAGIWFEPSLLGFCLFSWFSITASSSLCTMQRYSSISSWNREHLAACLR